MTPKGIVLHISASSFGDALQIDQWHRSQGWSGIGYHFVVLNGKNQSSDIYNRAKDGLIEIGRAENIKGAHCKANSMNTCTLGICSIGMPNHLIGEAVPASSDFVINKSISQNQLNTLINKAAQLCLKHKLNPAASFLHPSTGVSHPVITQHSMHEKGKPLCASLNIDKVRQAIVERYQMISNGLLNESEVAELQETYLMDEPELIENELPEFQAPLGGENGPDDLEVDIKAEIYQ